MSWPNTYTGCLGSINTWSRAQSRKGFGLGCGWERAIDNLRSALEKGLPYQVNEGTALFTVKIDFHLKDALGHLAMWHHPAGLPDAGTF